MKKRTKSVFGIFPDRVTAEKGVDALRAENFRAEDISILLPETETSAPIAHVKTTKAPEGATAGAGTGAVIGGTLGLLAGIGALGIPGLGPFIAAGPIMGALAGAGLGGAVGGVSGALIGFGLPEYEARRYEGIVKSGGILISVHVDDTHWGEKAKDILERQGARDIAATPDLASSDELGWRRPVDAVSETPPADSGWARPDPMKRVRTRVEKAGPAVESRQDSR